MVISVLGAGAWGTAIAISLSGKKNVILWTRNKAIFESIKEKRESDKRVGEKSGKDQAEHFLETIGDSSNILLALDIEENKDGKSIMPKQAEDFVNRVYLVTGRLPLIYGSPSFLKDFAKKF